MAVFLIIVSVLFWAASLAALPKRPLYAPALSYIALIVLSFAKRDGFQLVPLNNTILIGWLCMTLVVMLATMMQPAAVRVSTRGMGYMIGGALTGMAVGLLGFSFSTSLPLLYGIMIVATAVGVFFGFLLWSRTPAGVGMRLPSQNFFRYLMAKGFPTAITVMMIGVALVLVLALNVPQEMY